LPSKEVGSVSPFSENPPLIKFVEKN